MIKNATLFLLLVAFAVSMSFAQERQTKVVKMKTPGPSIRPFAT